MTTKQDYISEFTRKLNEQIPVDMSEKVSRLIRIISKQVKLSVFQFDLEQLERDILAMTQEHLRAQLTTFFKKIEQNQDRVLTIDKQKETTEKKRTKDKKAGKVATPNKSGSLKRLPIIKGVPEAIVRKSKKNEEERRKREGGKQGLQVMPDRGVPKRAR